MESLERLPRPHPLVPMLDQNDADLRIAQEPQEPLPGRFTPEPTSLTASTIGNRLASAHSVSRANCLSRSVFWSALETRA